MTQRHKHADLIIAWANGAEIEFRDDAHSPWRVRSWTPGWVESREYRVKPVPWRHPKWHKEIEAYTLHGKVVQQRRIGEKAWSDWLVCPSNHRPERGMYASGFDNEALEFRIKPEPVVKEVNVRYSGDEHTAPCIWSPTWIEKANIKLTFEEGKLVAAEVLK